MFQNYLGSSERTYLDFQNPSIHFISYVVENDVLFPSTSRNVHKKNCIIYILTLNTLKKYQPSLTYL